MREHRSTLLLATPTFLLAYLRRAKREDFATLRLVITGAEKLKAKVADAFEEQFGIRPLEGYGATELAPVITLSLPDVEMDGVRQPGSKDGSVGHPIPGVVIKVVDPESGAELKPGEAGLMLVQGPQRHARLPGPAGARPPRSSGTAGTSPATSASWTRTASSASPTASRRFSKIGGEMVPHGAVEDELHGRLGQAGVVAVTAVPDEKKGERLVVVLRPGGHGRRDPPAPPGGERPAQPLEAGAGLLRRGGRPCRSSAPASWT